MRTMKIVTVLGLMLALTVPASALTLLGGYTGPIKIKLSNWDMGQTYAPGYSANNEVDVNNNVPIVPGGGVINGFNNEDAWLVFKVKTIEDVQDNVLWASGQQGVELIGIGYGIRDVAVDTTTSMSYIWSTGGTFDIYEQPVGTFDFRRGSAGRVSQTVYKGVGDTDYDGDIDAFDTSTLMVTTTEIPGIGSFASAPPGSIPAPGSFERVYKIDTSLTAATGDTFAYADATAGVWGDGNMGNGELVQGQFVDAVDGTLDLAELQMHARTNVYIPIGQPGNPDPDPNPFGPGVDDWLFESEDPINTAYAVPEPLTMLALFGGIAGLGGYIRKRRMA